MASNRPITYLDALKMFAERGTGRQDLDYPFRANTVLRMDVSPGEDQSIRFGVHLYDTRIAVLFADGAVTITSGGHRTNTTKNRLNDVLIPMGWKVRDVGGVWNLVSRDRRRMEFMEGMMVYPLPNTEVHKQHFDN